MTTRRALGLMVALTVAGGAGAQDCGWEWVNPTPPRADIHRLTVESGAFVGVGAAGTIIRSTQPFEWNVMDSGVDADLFGIDWGGGNFVAVGDGVILRSTTGVDWSPEYESDAVLLDVEYSVSRFVAVGHGIDGQVLTSLSGVDWESAPAPWIGGADSIAGSDTGFYVAVGGEIWFSADGFVWEYQGSVPTAPGLSPEHSDTKKVGSDLFELDRIDLGWTGSRLLWAGGSDLFSRALDGSWKLAAELGGCPPFSDWLGLASGPGWAMASGISECPSAYFEPTVSMLISTDGGINFSEPWETQLGGFPGLSRNGARWIAAGALGDVMTRLSTTNWSCDGGECSSLACADGFVDLARGEDSWVAVGGVGLCESDLKRIAGGTAARSADGSHWEILPLPGERFRGLTTFGSEFIGVGHGWLARSGDGENWTTENFPDGARLNAIGSGNGWVVAAGEAASLYVSDDGHTWNKIFLYLPYDLDRVIWDGEQFIVLGLVGTILRSADGTNWVPAYTNATEDLKGAVAGENQRIAVGDGGVILASSDGEVWLPRRSGVDSFLRDVTWAEDRFVAVGWDQHPDGSRPGVVLISSDGVIWTRMSAPAEALERIRWTGSSWLTVGGERTILRTECLGAHFEIETELLRVPEGETTDLIVRLSEEVDADTPVSVRSSMPGRAIVPQTVTVLKDSDTVHVPVTGSSVASGVVLTLGLPEDLGGGTTTILASVEPPQGTPRTPSGRVRP